MEGAEGYVWEIVGPGDAHIKAEIYRDTRLKLPDSVLTSIPDGEYRWRIVPLRNGKWGTPSDWRSFVVSKMSDQPVHR